VIQDVRHAVRLLRRASTVTLSDRRFIMMLLAVTDALALLLAAAGVYGVVSYVTGRRTHEIGIRMALGASSLRVLVLVFRRGMGLAAAGIGIGLLAVPAVVGALRHTLAGIEFASPALFWMTLGLVTLTAATACWLPARRDTHRPRDGPPARVSARNGKFSRVTRVCYTGPLQSKNRVTLLRARLLSPNPQSAP
jgi:putative ABC transport system permease protein